MARDLQHAPFPFPVPAPPPVQPRSTPFPPPQLPKADETANVMKATVAGVPVPLFFAIGAVVGIVAALTVVTVLRWTSSKRVARASVVSVHTAPAVESARGLFISRPASAAERAPIELEPAAEAPEAAPPSNVRAAVASHRAPAVGRMKNATEKTEKTEKRSLAGNLLSAGL